MCFSGQGCGAVRQVRRARTRVHLRSGDPLASSGIPVFSQLHGSRALRMLLTMLSRTPELIIIDYRARASVDWA